MHGGAGGHPAAVRRAAGPRPRGLGQQDRPPREPLLRAEPVRRQHRPQRSTAISTAAETLGPVLGSPAVDYATDRIYFASRRLSTGLPTVWCLQVTASSPPRSHRAPAGRSHQDLGEFDTSPTCATGGSTSPTTPSTRSTRRTGGDARTFAPSDGPVRGLRVHRPGQQRSLLRHHHEVWSLSGRRLEHHDPELGVDDPGRHEPVPRPVLAGANYLYVGGQRHGSGSSHLDHAPPRAAKSLVLGDGKGRIGAPSIDTAVESPDSFLLVGSEVGRPLRREGALLMARRGSGGRPRPGYTQGRPGRGSG